MMRRLLLTVAALGLALFAAPALAQSTNTGNLTVTANVVTSCMIDSPALDFGNYVGTLVDPTTVTPAPATASATITVTCNTASHPFTVRMGSGQNAGGTTGRQMASGGALLEYSLFSDAGLASEWLVDTTRGTSTAAAPPLVGTLDVYGVIAANQIVTPGIFTDTVLMTVSF